MAVVPGFSVTDLIQAVGHIKTVYDSFFDKYTNSATQLRDLADQIQQFQTNLQANKETIESRGLAYSGYVSIKRTLDECEDFLEKYKAVLDTKVSVAKLYRTGRFPYDKETVARLQKQIESHKIDILHFNLNILLYVVFECVACSPRLIANNLDRQDSCYRENTITPNTLSQAVDIPARSDTVITLPLPPPLLSEIPHVLEGSQLSVSPGCVSPQSPEWGRTSGSRSGQDSVQGSPGSRPVVPRSQGGLDLKRQDSDIVLQRPLDYCVAKMLVRPDILMNITHLHRTDTNHTIDASVMISKNSGARLRVEKPPRLLSCSSSMKRGSQDSNTKVREFSLYLFIRS
jgi:hypothetical protein